MSSPPSPSSPQAQLHGAVAVGVARELATAPLPPLTSVLVVVRSGAGARVAALPHVVAAISDFLDYGLPQFWSLPRACEADLLSLLPRLVVRGVSTGVDPYYWKYQCGQGLVAAVKHDNLKMIKWLHLRCPCVLPYSAMAEAAKIGNSGLLQWFAARHEQIVWIPQMMDAAASTGQTEVLQWLYDRPNSNECMTRIAFASAVRGNHPDTVK